MRTLISSACMALVLACSPPPAGDEPSEVDPGPAEESIEDEPVEEEPAAEETIDPVTEPETEAPVVEEPVEPEIDPDNPHGIHAQLLPICRKVGPGYDEACDIEKPLIHLPPDEPRPNENHLFPGVTSFNMNGWEWWQQWPGGHDGALFEAELATDAGLKCSVASALRFAAVIKGAPIEIWTLLDETNWEGRFYNWNDDYSHPASIGNGDGPELWAWQTHLIKWISKTNKDGSCYLPTRTLLEKALKACIAKGAANFGEIKDCYAK